MVANVVSVPLKTFAICEWVYSAIDRGFFLRNEFEECMVELGIPQVCVCRRCDVVALPSHPNTPLCQAECSSPPCGWM